MSQLTTIQFLQKLKDSVKEYRKQINDTRSEEDAAHFFNPSLKTFLRDSSEELGILSNMNFDKSFLSWVKNYLK